MWTLLAMGAVLAFPGAGRAATDTLSLATIPGQPSDAATVQVDASGTNSGDYLYVSYRPAGTGGCAADPNVDTGSSVAPSGSYSVTVDYQQVLDAGQYLLCAWLVDQQYPTPLTATSKVITVHQFSERGKASAFTSNPSETFPCRTGTVRYSVRTG